MIGRIAGTLIEKNPPQLLVDCQGVGYEVDVPMSTFYNLPALGEKVALLTHLAIREDAHVLLVLALLKNALPFVNLSRLVALAHALRFPFYPACRWQIWPRQLPCKKLAD